MAVGRSWRLIGCENRYVASEDVAEFLGVVGRASYLLMN